MNNEIDVKQTEKLLSITYGAPDTQVKNLNDSYDIIYCSQIVIYTLFSAIIKWSLVSESGQTLYVSEKNYEFDTCIIDLSTLNIIEETKFYLKADMGVESTIAFNIPFVYESHYRAIYYKFIKDKLHVYLCRLAYPYCYSSTPIVECSTFAANHTDGGVILHWGITTISGTLIFKSDQCRKGHTWNFDLANLNIPAGTQVKLKALISAGSDSVAYIILKYDPTMPAGHYFEFYGNAIKNVTVFAG